MRVEFPWHYLSNKLDHFHKTNKVYFFCSVPTFVNLPEETLIKIADVLEEVSKFLLLKTKNYTVCICLIRYCPVFFAEWGYSLPIEYYTLLRADLMTPIQLLIRSECYFYSYHSACSYHLTSHFSMDRGYVSYHQMVCYLDSGDLKSDHFKSGLFEVRISTGLFFKWSGFSYGYSYSPNHSKSRSCNSYNTKYFVILIIQNILKDCNTLLWLFGD